MAKLCALLILGLVVIFWHEGFCCPDDEQDTEPNIPDFAKGNDEDLYFAWPNFQGKSAELAKKAILAEKPHFDVAIIRESIPGPSDFNLERVLIRADKEGKVVGVPYNG